MEDALRERLARLDLAAKVRLLTGADFWSLHPEPAVGLRRVVVSDGPAGVRGERWDEREPSANVPSPTALAATWDPERIYRIGALLAAECRRKGVDVLLAPTVNLHRTPFGGRHFECLSEDPLLTARIAGAYVRGLQDHGVGATVKHFVANDSETERFTVDVRVGDRPLRELYLAPFADLVRDAAPWAVMAAYNAVDGHTMTESPLLADVLVGEWGFDGVVMSDWFAARSTEPAARAALDLAMPGPDGPWGDALVAAVRAGRVPEAAVDAKVLRILRLAARVGALDGLPAGRRPPALSDRDIARELREAAAASFVLARNAAGLLPFGRRQRIALIGTSGRTLGGGSATVFAPYVVSPLDGLRAAGLEVANAPGVRIGERLPVADAGLLRGGAVRAELLDADGAVVVSEQRLGGTYAWDDADVSARTAVVEIRATLVAAADGEHVVGCSGLGRFTLAVDGEERFDVHLALPAGADPAEAFARPPQHGIALVLRAGATAEVVLRMDRRADELAFGDAGVRLQLNVAPPHPGDDAALAQAEALAADADVAVVVVGTTDEVESEGFDRETLALPGRQDELVARVAAANPRTVVVVNAGAPVLLPWIDDVAGVLLAWFPGQEFGAALAAVVLGDSEPGGRLPTTWPASEDGLPSPRPVDGVLAYAEGLAVGHRDPSRDVLLPFGHGLGYTSWAYEELAVEDDAAHMRIRNTGPRAGHEVVQLYASRTSASAVERPSRWLAGFARVAAGPGEAARVTIPLPERVFAHWDGRAFVVESGTYAVAAGRSSADLRLRAELVLGPDR